MIPHVLELGETVEPRAEAWIVHGILGSATNWRGFARRLAATLPGWRLVLVDLRAHGASPRGEPPHDLDACAADLVALAGARGRTPDALIGHSFGGKVVLLASERLGAGVRQTWVLDAVPGPGTSTSSGGDEDVLAVIDALERIPQPLPSRDAIVAPLREGGFSDALVGWMTTNLQRGDAGFTWRFDLPIVRALIADYARRDLWPLVARLPGEVHLVRAGRSDRWTPDALARLDEASQAPSVEAHLLPTSGHWVHVDAPGALRDLLDDGLSRVVTNR